MTGVLANEEVLPGYESQGKLYYHTSFDRSLSIFDLSNRILSNTDPGLCDAAILGRRAAQRER